jgi:chorismate synthase
MWSNSFGDAFRITTFGESHGPAVGAVLDGVMPGLPLDQADVQAELERRRPGLTPGASQRREPDQVEILSGVFEGRTTGAPVALLVRNLDARPEDYQRLRELFRPGHGDQTWLAKYGVRDWRGGGRLSGRETVARVAAGAVARQVLKPYGVSVRGRVVSIADVVAEQRDPEQVLDDPLRCGDPLAAERMSARIREAEAAGDSLGGVVEVVARGVPAGWGDPVFGKLDAMLAQGLMSIGAVKGVEVGDGFALAASRGSLANDPILAGAPGSNHAGGILGGISNGAPVVVRLAIKPTPSIRLPQETVTTRGETTEISVTGRHDVCLCPRVVPVAEAMVALVLADACLAQQALQGAAADLAALRLEIDRADAELLRVLAYRAGLVRQAVQLKRAGRLPLRDAAREAEILEAWRGRALDLGLDPEGAARLARLVLRLTRPRP